MQQYVHLTTVHVTSILCWLYIG